MNNGHTSWLGAIKNKLIFLALLGFAVFAAYWLSTHSFIQISLANTADGQEVTYTLLNIDTGKIKEVKGDSQKRILVKRGQYQVSATVNSQSFYAFTGSTPRFLKSYKLQGQLTAERERIFVGESPRSCPAYTGTMLISGGCEGVYGEISIHKPSADKRSSYVVTNPDRKNYGQNMFMISTPAGLVSIVREPTTEALVDIHGESSELPSTYVSIFFNKNFSPKNKISLSALDGNKIYTFEQTSGGNLTAFDEANAEIYYFDVADLNKPPIKVALQKPKIENAILYATDSIGGGSYAALYAKSGNEDKEPESEVVLSEKGKNDRFLFRGKSYTSMRLCGTAKLCLQGSESGLDIYDISGGKVSRLITIPGALAIEMLKGRLLVVTNEGVISLDVDSQKGFLDYSLGGYRFVSLTAGDNNYVLTLKNLSQREIALLINQGTADTNSIDKKVLQLQAVPEVSFVSAYKNNIYVSANLGELVYDRKANAFTNDPARKQTAAKTINEALERIGIDRQKYTVTSNAF